MTRIKIPVQEVGHSSSPFVILQILLGGFTLGLVAGVLALNPSFLQTDRSAGINIASVGDATESGEDIFSPKKKNVEDASEEIFLDADIPALVTGDAQYDEEVSLDTEPATEGGAGEVAGVTDVASPSTTERAVAIERLSREIAQLKDSSVTIITQFNQNCGSWTDACALPYSTQLERNNSSYDVLAKQLNALLLGQ